MCGKPTTTTAPTAPLNVIHRAVMTKECLMVVRMTFSSFDVLGLRPLANHALCERASGGDGFGAFVGWNSCEKSFGALIGQHVRRVARVLPLRDQVRRMSAECFEAVCLLVGRFQHIDLGAERTRVGVREPGLVTRLDKRDVFSFWH